MRTLKVLVCILFCGGVFSDLSAQEITMFSGFFGNKYYQDDIEINKKDLQFLFDKNDEVSMYWNKSKTQGLVAAIAIAAEMGFAVWMTSELVNDDVAVSKDRLSNSFGPALGVIGSGIVGVYFYMHPSTPKRKRF